MFLRASVSLAVNQKGKCVTVGGEGHGLALVMEWHVMGSSLDTISQGLPLPIP